MYNVYEQGDDAFDSMLLQISKSNVVDDMVESNELLYTPGEHPDHCVVIKYVPYVGDSKRAMDEYTSEILMGGHNTIVIHNTCEDSLLASSLILDLIILTELCLRIQFRVDGQQEFEGFVEPFLSTHSIVTTIFHNRFSRFFMSFCQTLWLTVVIFVISWRPVSSLNYGRFGSVSYTHLTLPTILRV